MRSNWIGIVSVLLFVFFIYYDCNPVAAKVSQGSEENASLAYLLTEKEEEKAKEMIKAKFNRIFSKHVKDQSGDLILKYSLQEARAKSREEKVLRLEEMGFPQMSDLKDVNVTQKLQLDYVGLEALGKYQKGGDPWKIIEKKPIFIFKITISSKEKALQDGPMSKQPFAELELVTDEKDQKSTWRFSSYGSSKAYQLLFRAKEEADLKEPPVGDTQCSIISIPALEQSLLGCIKSGELKINIMDNGIKKPEGYPTTKYDEFLPAHEVFEKLAEEVRKPERKFPKWPDALPQKKRPQP